MGQESFLGEKIFKAKLPLFLEENDLLGKLPAILTNIRKYYIPRKGGNAIKLVIKSRFSNWG